MKKALVILIAVLSTSPVFAIVHTEEFTGKVVALRNCIDTSVSAFGHVKVEDGSGQKKTVFLGLEKPNVSSIDASRKQVYATLLAAYMAGKPITLLLAVENTNFCGISSSLKLYGVSLGETF